MSAENFKADFWNIHKVGNIGVIGFPELIEKTFDVYIANFINYEKIACDKITHVA